MRLRSVHRIGGTVVTLLVVLALVAATIGAIFVFASRQATEESEQTVLLHTVERGDFEAFITEPGDVASSSNVEVRCRVKSLGSPGTPILKICEEGTNVKEGDFLVQFDDSVLQSDLLAQQIVVANDKAL